MTVFTAASQFSPDRVTYALRTAGDPLRYVRSVLGDLIARNVRAIYRCANRALAIATIGRGRLSLTV